MDENWRTMTCYLCNGTGLKTGLSRDDAGTCDCYQGVIWLRPKGHMFKYPGGPADGVGPEEWYEKGTPKMPWEWHALDEKKNDFDSFDTEDGGDWCNCNQVVCNCGWTGGYKDHDIHWKLEEKMFQQRKLRPN